VRHQNQRKHCPKIDLEAIYQEPGLKGDLNMAVNGTNGTDGTATVSWLEKLEEQRMYLQNAGTKGPGVAAC
jgi:hypothetical protein